MKSYVFDTESRPDSRPSFKDCRQPLHTSSEVVFSVDANGRIKFLSQEWQRHTGYSVSECLGKTIKRYMPATEFQRLIARQNKTRFNDTFCFLDSHAKPVWFEISANQYDGEYLGTLTKQSTYREIDEALDESEARFRDVVENVAEILFQTDRRLSLQFVNPAWTAITGFSQAEALGKSILDFIVEEDRRTCTMNTDFEQLTSQPCHQELRLKCKDGRLRWMSIRVRTLPTKKRDSCLITGVMLDITERKEMEQNLRRSEERYALLASSTTDGIWDWDLATDQVYFSPRWKAMIGYEDHEIENVFNNWYERVHPEDIQLAMAEVSACLENRKPYYENIHRMRHKNGSWCWILDRGIVLRDDNGQPYRMVGSHADVTVLKKTEDTLRQREHEQEAIFSISPDGIVTINQQGFVQSINPAFLEMTGFDSQKLLGLAEHSFEQSLLEISRLDSSSRQRNNPEKRLYYIDLKKLRSHRYRQKPRESNKSERGQSPKIRVLARTERHIQNHAIAKVMYFRDISAESEVDQMKSQFLSTAAHELRTPMASVFGFSELLLTRQFDTETQLEIISTIHQQSGALVNMLNQLLDLARIESRMGMDFSFIKQSLWPIVQRAIAELLIPGDTRKVKIRPPKFDYQVLVDADKLRQVISNVLVNAYKYSPGNGEISLSFRTRISADSEPEVGIVIRDHGLGMTREQLKHVFERFWRADNSGGISGTGLGMSLVKEIMDIHAGSIDIKSQPNIGTTVTLWLRHIETTEFKDH